LTYQEGKSANHLPVREESWQIELQSDYSTQSRADILVRARPPGRGYIAGTLRKTNLVVGGRTSAAAKLGMPRTTLISSMQNLGILRERPLAQAGWGFEYGAGVSV